MFKSIVKEEYYVLANTDGRRLNLRREASRVYSGQYRYSLTLSSVICNEDGEVSLMTFPSYEEAEVALLVDTPDYNSSSKMPSHHSLEDVEEWFPVRVNTIIETNEEVITPRMRIHHFNSFLKRVETNTDMNPNIWFRRYSNMYICKDYPKEIKKGDAVFRDFYEGSFDRVVSIEEGDKEFLVVLGISNSQ